MNFVKIIGSSVFQILSFVFFLSYLFGIINIHFNDKNDYCVMTYMYEYPQFVVSWFLIFNLSKFIEWVILIFSQFYSEYRCRKMLYIHSMASMHTARADLQKEPERCGMLMVQIVENLFKKFIKSLVNIIIVFFLWL